jgi:hypothetical protein
MKNPGFEVFVAVLLGAFMIGCDNRVTCDEETFEWYCDGNTLVLCGGYTDEKNYTDETWVTRRGCPAEQPYCVTTERGPVCSFATDLEYCGIYVLDAYCEGNIYTDCRGPGIYRRDTCAEGEVCTPLGCDKPPEVRDAELWQGCDEACGEKVCRLTDIMGPYPEAPELPIEVEVGGATGYFDLEDGSRLYFGGCDRPGSSYPVDAIAQHCFCYDPP